MNILKHFTRQNKSLYQLEIQFYASILLSLLLFRILNIVGDLRVIAILPSLYSLKELVLKIKEMLEMLEY